MNERRYRPPICAGCGEAIYPGHVCTGGVREIHTPLSKEERTKLAKEFFDTDWDFQEMSPRGTARRKAVLAFVEWYFGPKEGTG